MHTFANVLVRRVWLLGVVLSLSLVLAACGGEDPASPGGEPTADAAADGGEGATPDGTEEDGDDGAEAGADGEPIQVGVLMDLSQTFAFIGTPTLAGVRTATDAINRAGGIDGRPIELVVQDDRTDAENARTSFRQLVDGGVVAVIGPNASSTLVPLAPVIEESQVPNLSLAAVADLHRPARPYLYAVGLHVADSALIDVQFMRQYAEENGIESPRVAALSLDTPAVQEFRDMLEDAVPDFGELVSNEVVAVDATDMASSVLPVAQADPDFVPVGLLGTQLPGAVSSLRDRGSDAPVINYFVASDQATFEAVDDPSFYAVRHYAEPDEEDLPAVQRMREEAEQAGQSGDLTNAYFTYGYVTTQLLAEALRSCSDPCDGPAVDAALSEIRDFDTEGLSGPLGVSEDDHLFVKYGRVFGWDPDARRATPVGDWIGGRGTGD
jgi:branched-chain amino acid transport system substrate-binding protein